MTRYLNWLYQRSLRKHRAISKDIAETLAWLRSMKNMPEAPEIAELRRLNARRPRPLPK